MDKQTQTNLIGMAILIAAVRFAPKSMPLVKAGLAGVLAVKVAAYVPYVNGNAVGGA